MPRINLLPWRETRRKEREQRFQINAGVAIALAGAITYLLGMQIDDQITAQKKRNAYLEKELKTLDVDVKSKKDLEKKQQDLIERMKVVERLQRSRTGTVRLFNEIPMVLPDGVFLREITQSDESLTITGQAGSNADVSEYMRRISNAENTVDPKLLSINTNAQDFTVDFQLEVQLRDYTKEGTEDDAKVKTKTKGKTS